MGKTIHSRREIRLKVLYYIHAVNGYKVCEAERYEKMAPDDEGIGNVEDTIDAVSLSEECGIHSLYTVLMNIDLGQDQDLDLPPNRDFVWPGDRIEDIVDRIFDDPCNKTLSPS